MNIVVILQKTRETLRHDVTAVETRWQ